MSDTEWIERAACKGEPVTTFFPEPSEPTTRAQALCASCTVRGECLAYALDDPSLVGWWGGTNERERAKMRRRAA